MDQATLSLIHRWRSMPRQVFVATRGARSTAIVELEVASDAGVGRADTLIGVQVHLRIGIGCGIQC